MRLMTARLAGPLVLAAATLVLAPPAQAAESIPTYRVAVEVRPDTSLAIEETIAYDFSDTPDRHGIYRDIVVADTDTLGRTRRYEVDVESVSIDGTPVDFTESDEDPFLRVRIGDPDVTVSGPHTYVIAYTVANGLRVITAEDLADPQMPEGLAAGDVEFYWDLVENTFEVPILSATGHVVGPASPLAGRCLAGPAGSTGECPITAEGPIVDLGPVRLGDGDFLTTVLAYPASAFTQAPVEVIETNEPPTAGLAIGGLALLGLAVVPPFLAVLWRRRDKGVIVQGIPVRFDPPDQLRAAPMAASWQGESASMRPRALVAELLDLASRGHIVIDDADELTVRHLDGPTGDLGLWESNLLGALFANGSPARLDKYDALLASTWKAEYRRLVTDAEKTGRRNPQGGRPDRRWNVLLVTAFLALLAMIGSFVVEWVNLAIAAGGIAVGAFVGGVIARAITPRSETAQSAAFLAWVLGFRRLLETDAAAARREFAQRLGLPPHAILATMLPYAVVFDLEESWVGAFPDLTPEELRSTGVNVATAAALGAIVGHASSSASSALTAPSSGSGSGGSSGGGGGGGGGGAW